LSFPGKLKIALRYAGKKFMSRSYDADPNGVLKSWNENRNFWQALPSSPDIFSGEDSQTTTQKISMNLLFRINTMNYLCAKLAGNEY
jgi:hypothetical protein